MTRVSVLARTAGVLLVVVPFVPVERIFGPLGDGAQGYVGPGEWLLGLFVFGSVGWLLARALPGLPRRLRRSLQEAARRLAGMRHPALPILLVLAGVILLVSWTAFRQRPLLVDSVVQLFQAQIFADGRLVAPPPPDEAFVATQHMLVNEAGWFAQYPPGHALLLAVGVLAGLPWLVPVVLSLGTAGLLYRFSRIAWGDDCRALLTPALLLLAPFFWVMGASFMNHVSCLFFLAVFLVCFARWEESSGPGWALACGLAIGAAGLSRPLTALAVAAVFAPVGLVVAARRRSRVSIAMAGGGALAAIVLYLLYNSATTGDPMVPGYLALWGEAHGVGFHASPWGGAHTPLTGLRNELIDLSLLSVFFLEWPVPALLPAGIYLAATGGRDAWDRRLAAATLAIPAAYFFYWHRDAYLGPRFLYSSLLFLVPLTARGLLAVPELPSGRLRLRETAVLAIALCFVYSVFYAAPRRVSVYASSQASMKVDPSAIARRGEIERGVVFVAVSWGNRLLARMRGAGVDASTSEVVYRSADHCEIELTLRRARAEGWTVARLSVALESLPRGRAEEIETLNGDPTLRLVPDRALAPVCREELEHDAAGYGNWLPFLPANDPALENPVLYVRDLRDLNGHFMATRPDRPAWLHRPGRLERLPQP